MVDNLEPGMSEFIDPNSHPAISQRRKKKAATVQPASQSAEERFGELFNPGTESAPNTSESSAGASKTVLPIRPSAGDSKVGTNEQVEKDQAGVGNGAMTDYSNEARVYHAQYEALSQDHDNGLFYKCREGCKDLLTEPNLPHYTRVQTLQMLSTILTESGAEQCLKDAAEVLSKMDAAKFQVQLLKSDNDKMLADLHTWRMKEGLLGADLEEALIDREKTGTRNTEAPEYWRFDRDIQQSLDQELEEELEHIGYVAPGYATTATAAGQEREREEKEGQGLSDLVKSSRRDDTDEW